MSSAGSNSKKAYNGRKPFKRGHNFKKGNINKDRSTFGARQYLHHDQLIESDVGICEYMSKLAGYPAVIKARYSDFQVNEIDEAGNMAKLTDRSIPKCFIETAEVSYVSTTESPVDKIPQDTWEALRNMILSTDDKPVDSPSPVELDAESFSKDERKHIHECVKKYFGQEVVASTITKNSKTIMQFAKSSKKTKDTRTKWPEGVPEFVHFVLYKEMMDTIDACFKIGQALKMSSAGISYAGVKDKRAKTTQWCCIRKYAPSNLLSKTERIRNLKVGNIILKDHCLKIGKLSGNLFRIALRNVQAEDDVINDSFNHVKEHGFINYYGLQRFGNDKEVPTFAIGIKLLLGEWKEAVDFILKVKTADDQSQPNNQAKKVYAETGDAQKALKLCDKHRQTVEKKLLEGLVKHHKNNPLNALENIPRNIRLMYIHAFQSLIWNKMTSKRIEKFGLKPVEGDLVIVDKSEVEESTNECPTEGENTGEADDDESTDVTVEPKKRKGRFSVRPLTADELQNYSIFDIVLPLPGFDIVYPEHLKQYYKEAIEEHGLTLEMPEKKVKTYNLSGTYRNVVQHAKDLEWKIMYYNDPTYNLIRSDLQELNGEEEPKSVVDGKYKAIVLSFSLHSACYATMVLREILKCNTSTSAQAVLNNYGEKKLPKAKVIIDCTNDSDQGKEDLDIKETQPGSLLADKAKYEDFKNNLFKDILGGAENDTDTSQTKERDEEENDIPNKKIKMSENV